MRSDRHRKCVVILSVLIGLPFIPGLLRLAPLRGAPVDADILLRGGTLHLGDGQPATVGDLAIVGERIVAVGEFETGAVRKVIDCRGLVVSPGFIDLHNHSDRQVLRRDTRAVVNYLTQGCTTIVTGNCGSGPIDVASYYEKMDSSGIGLNVAHLLPQGALRRAVIGNERRKASAEELLRMKELTAKAMRAGAWGLSTGLIYVPSSYADTAELIELCKVVGEHGGIYASHIRNENVKLLEAVEEALEIGRRAKLPVHISHFKYLANWDQVGSGGLLSTIDYLFRWDQNVYDKKVGGEDLHSLLRTRGVLNDGTVLDYAFGLVLGEYKGLRTVGHGGSFMGFRTVTLRFPDERFSVIILANLGRVNPDALAKKIADVYLAGPIAKRLEVYAGRFRSEELGVVYEVAVRGTDLVITYGSVAGTLAASADRDAFSTADTRIEFNRDAVGRVNELRLSTGGANNLRFERID